MALRRAACGLTALTCRAGLFRHVPTRWAPALAARPGSGVSLMHPSEPEYWVASNRRRKTNNFSPVIGQLREFGWCLGLNFANQTETLARVHGFPSHCLDETDHQPTNVFVGNLHERLSYPKRLPVERRARRGKRLVLSVFGSGKKLGDWYMKRIGEVVEPGSCDTVDALLVFLNLLVRHFKGFSELLLSHLAPHAPEANS